MPTKDKRNYPRNVLEQSEVVQKGWRKLGSALQVPNLTYEEFVKLLAEAKEKAEHTERLRQEWRRAVRERDQALQELWDLTKRVRNAAKATFGDRAPQVHELGGRRPRRKRAGREDNR